MKIYRFTDLASHSRAGTAGAHAAYKLNQGRVPRPFEGGSDMVEISPEARQRFEQARVTQIEQARLLKLVSEYSPMVKKRVAQEDDIPSRINRHLDVYEIREMVRRGTYDFDSDAVMKGSADPLLEQFLPEMIH